MEIDEIVRSYRQADNKTEQVMILAELTASDAETIIEILKDAGAICTSDIHKRICCRCGHEYITPSRKGLAVCPDCKSLNIKILELERRIKRNNAKINEHGRCIGKLSNSNGKLRAKIEELKKGEKDEGSEGTAKKI